MSSTVSSAEIQTISSKHLEDKTQRLVRTSSLEKIKQFNSFICSQQCYILPALLAWLRSSNSLLHSSTERTIFFFRSLIFSHFLYKVYKLEFRLIVSNVLILLRKHFSNYNLLKFLVYLTALVLVTELGLCFYFLCCSYMPGGLLFLIICWFYISGLNVYTVYGQPTKNGAELTKKVN